jgi:hypothetical protein
MWAAACSVSPNSSMFNHCKETQGIHGACTHSCTVGSTADGEDWRQHARTSSKAISNAVRPMLSYLGAAPLFSSHFPSVDRTITHTRTHLVSLPPSSPVHPRPPSPHTLKVPPMPPPNTSHLVVFSVPEPVQLCLNKTMSGT